MGWDWNYSGPADELVVEIHKCFFKPFEEFTDEYKTSVRRQCAQAIELDDNCYPAFAALGYLDDSDSNSDGMLRHYLEAIDRCDRPLDSEMLIETVFLGLYEEARHKPSVWPSIVTLWERIHEKQPEWRSVKSICVACRFVGDPRVAHKVIDEWQRANPDDAVKLARLAMKRLGDPRKAEGVLERHLSEHPEDRKAKRLLAKVGKALENRL